MKFEVIEWNTLYDETITYTSEIVELGERINSDENSELLIEIVFNLLFIVDLYYTKNLTKKILSIANFVVEYSSEIENYYNLPEELFDLKEKDFINKIINNHELIKNYPLNINILFVNQRKKLLKIIEFVFKSNESNISKYSYTILNSCNVLTKKLRNGYLYGIELEILMSKRDFFNENKMELINSKPPFPLDLVKTFINAIKQTKISRILDISKDDTKYGLLAWLNGFNTTIIDSNIQRLSYYEILTYQYKSLFNNHLIFPPNDENIIASVVCVKDSLPELKRLRRIKKNIFDGIIANFTFHNLSKEEIYSSIDCLISLLSPNGYILIQDYFKTDEKSYSDINTLSINKTEFEQYLEKKLVRILLRTNDFHLIIKTSYILQKKLQ